MTKGRGDVVIHEKDVFVLVRDSQVIDPFKVTDPSCAIDKFGLVGKGGDGVERLRSRVRGEGGVEYLAVLLARTLYQTDR